MREYCKINTIWKRDTANRNVIMPGQWSMPEFEYLADNTWLWTEKVDGTNIRIHWDGQKIKFGGRTADAQTPMFLLDHLMELFYAEDQKRLRSALPDGGFTLYGEGYGAKIQKGGGNYSPGPQFVLFDVLADHDEGPLWLERPNVEDIAAKLGIGVVPVLNSGPLEEAAEWAGEGILSTWGDFQAEGLVMRPATELYSRRGERIIAKIKTKDYVALAKHSRVS